MSWINLDDQILNHDKFVLAVKRAGRLGGDVVFLWLGIRAYCAQRLTDGFVPTEMLSEVRGPADKKQRAAALQVLLDVGLLDTAEGGVQMHDYLQWARSRDDIMMDRDRSRKRQAKSRGMSQRDSADPIPSVTAPLPSLTIPSHTSAADGAQTPAPAREGPELETDPADEHETVCPLDLVEKAERLGVLAELALALSEPLDVVRHEAREFLAYWTIGKGTGRRKVNWMRELRERIRRQKFENRLKAPGAVEHESRRREQRDDEPRRALPSPFMAGIVRPDR